MPPNKSNTTESKITQPATNQDDDALFIVPPPPEPEPLSRGKLALIISLTVFGILIIIGAVLFSLSFAAKQAAYNYDKTTSFNLSKLDNPLKDLRPSAVLNRRDVSSPLTTIKKIQQTETSLSEVLLGASLSPDYNQSKKLTNQLNQHYQSLLEFTNDMEGLVTFSDTVQDVITQEAKLTKLTNVSSSIALRSAAGSLSEDAKRVQNVTAPSELAAIKEQLAVAMNKKSKAYQAWAIAVEKHKSVGIKTAKQQISQANKAIDLAASDAEYAKVFESRYSTLQKQQLVLKRQAAL